jgi:hypothetical protein
MSSMNSLARLGMISVAVAAVMLTGGCSGGESASSKAGGAAPPVVLQMGNAYGDLNGPPAIQYFVSQVEERSGGNLRVESKDAGDQRRRRRDPPAPDFAQRNYSSGPSRRTRPGSPRGQDH